jgi:hypothetical protein
VAVDVEEPERTNERFEELFDEVGGVKRFSADDEIKGGDDEFALVIVGEEE